MAQFAFETQTKQANISAIRASGLFVCSGRNHKMQKILILGGGFAGYHVAKGLEKQLKDG